jgi:uncharacterized protein YqgC (DUF456 family)
VEPALALALVLMAVGLVGTVVPALPGISLVFAGTLLYAVATGFERVGIGHLLLFAGLTLLAMALGFAAHALGARAFGATRWGIVGAIVGLLVGLLVAGPLGLLLGPLVGAVALEAASGQPLRQAWRSGVGTLFGFLLGTAAELTLALVIVISFVRLTLA